MLWSKHMLLNSKKSWEPNKQEFSMSISTDKINEKYLTDCNVKYPIVKNGVYHLSNINRTELNGGAYHHYYGLHFGLNEQLIFQLYGRDNKLSYPDITVTADNDYNALTFSPLDTNNTFVPFALPEGGYLDISFTIERIG